MQPQQYPPQYAQQPPAGMPAMYNPGSSTPVLPGFTAPAVGGGIGPSMAELSGRACIFLPKRIERNVASDFEPGKTSDMVTFDLVVLDGPLPFMFGAAPRAKIPRLHPTHQLSTLPALFKGQMARGVNVTRALGDVIDGAVLARVVQGVGTKGSPPWNLAELDPNDPANAVANQLRSVWAQFYANPPEPMELAQQVVQHPSQMQHPAMGVGPQGQYLAPAQQYPPQQGGPVEQYDNPSAGYMQQHPQQQGGPVAGINLLGQYIAPAQPAESVPAGWDAGVWAQLSPQQKAGILGGPAAPMPAY